MLEMLVKERMEQVDRRHNPNFIVADIGIIQQALNERFITKIGESKSKNGNVYYKINRPYGWNAVLMHVKDDKYIVINALVNHGNGLVDLVNELVNYSFCTKVSNNRERVIWNVTKEYKHFNVTQIPIERIIESYMVYGELRALPSYMHLHHKAQTWDNRESTTMYIHEYFHKHSKRHLSGRYIDSIDRFYELLKEVEKNEEYYRGINVVK